MPENERPEQVSVDCIALTKKGGKERDLRLDQVGSLCKAPVLALYTE